ncbi:MAG: Fic family protein [Planctomycetota bacterium]|nr:MAG: Fic family protein [Planctomycetota bacterium]REJ91450.1 MAG: Fic family protein [Planctomycetota bacterium]REK25587.1 MAG: Fic family protein [Planctomycetota bacterium]REK31702.1 MAG: Fic family protein [Planctomycetota bacterium]
MEEYPDGLLGDPVATETWAFVPDDLPPDLNWPAIRLEHFDLYTQTVSELGKLNGLHKRVGKAAGLLRTLWMREAKLSSQIEDIETTAEELVLAGAGRRLGVRESGLESWNCVLALEHGVSSDLPWSVRVIKEMHRLLLSDVRGEEKRPGELRQRGVYIGGRTHGVKGARFVPMPAGDEMVNALSQLERFVNTRHDAIPPLFVIALTHYQFETIHPFSDGNGRIGRVLISRSLVKEGLLEHPVVYMSAYINQHKQQYVDLLLNISRHGGEYWSHWIGFILDAVRTQALDAIWRSERLISLRERYHDRLKEDGAPSRLFQVVDELFAMPAINVKEIAQRSGITKPTANSDVQRLEQLGILSEYTGRKRDRDWVAREIIHVIEEDEREE